MACPHSAVACAIASVPDTAWWLSMLQVFVPVASALGLALLGYYFTLKSDLRAKSTEARLAIQRQALEDAQHALMTFWTCAAKLLRYPFSERLERRDLVTGLEDASVEVTVAHSRLADRQLADDIAIWHFATSLRLQSERAAQSADDVNTEHMRFVALSNRMGVALRELSAPDGKPASVSDQVPMPVLGIGGEVAAD
jgi:hypothetical protein